MGLTQASTSLIYVRMQADATVAPTCIDIIYILHVRTLRILPCISRGVPPIGS